MGDDNELPLLVIGAGPAGLGAAIEAARAGLRCTILDEASRVGGQIYRIPPEEFHVEDPRALGRDFERGQQLRRELAEVAHNVDVVSGASVVGIWDQGKQVVWTKGERSTAARARHLVIATGAYDRPVPFPGWTLPGVLTAGGAQVLSRTLAIRPGDRALVAGTGPLLLVVANQLAKVGVEVVAVLEAGRPSWSPRQLPHVWGQWDLLRDAFHYLRGLRRARIPLLFNHTIFEATGTNGVERAVYGPIDRESWKPIRARVKEVAVDLVVAGFGFVPNTSLTEGAGCAHRYVHELGGWIPIRDSDMQTSVANVFAAGDGCGVAGSLVAIEEGRIAGITVAERAGAISAAEATVRRAAPRARLDSMRGMRKLLDEISRIRPGLDELARADTLICRCEEVPLSDIHAAIDHGARDLQAVKLATRLGMGPCEGKNCAPSCAMVMARTLKCGPGEAGRIHARLPVKPVTLGTMATLSIHQPGERS